MNDYECEIRYHPGKANVVAYALSHKEHKKSQRVKALAMTIDSNLHTQIREAQLDSLKGENVGEESLWGIDKHFKLKDDGTHYFMNRIWTQKFGNIRCLVLEKAQRSRYSIHPGSNRMYVDLKKLYWWPNMKAEIATFMGKCLACSKVKAEHQRP